jgi:hypothetical protein
MAKQLQTRLEETDEGPAIVGESRWAMASAVIAATVLTALLADNLPRRAGLAIAHTLWPAARRAHPWGSGEDLAPLVHPRGTFSRSHGPAGRLRSRL